MRIVSINQGSVIPVRQFGGKAANLSALSQCNVRVPQGVAIGKDVLASFLEANQIGLRRLEQIHSLGMVFPDSVLAEAEDLQIQIVKAIREAPWPSQITEELRVGLSELKLQSAFAVRSSCVVEDATTTSFAGQYVTILGVRGFENIVSAIRQCWESQYVGRGVIYALSRRGMPVLSPSMAVLVQEMVEPDFAGVCFSKGPTKATADLTVLECVTGLGEALVSGERTPSHYEIDSNGRFLKRIIAADANPPDTVLLSVVRDTIIIAQQFGSPQDVEWAVKDNDVFILQARPVTVLGGKKPIASASSTLHQISNEAARGSPSTSRDHLLSNLRDDLHDWVIGQIDPVILRGATYILSSQQDSGSWKSRTNPEWEVASTAMTIRLLVDGGIPPSLEWALPRDGVMVSAGISKAALWLRKQCGADGLWGTDLWDTCKAISASVAAVPELTQDPIIRSAIERLTSGLLSNSENLIDSEWYGPGFYAAASLLFHELGDKNLSSRCIKMLVASQTPTGEFMIQGPRVSATSVEWHTSQAISSLAKLNNSDNGLDQLVEKACAWLMNRQRDDGSWGVDTAPYSAFNVIFSSYVIKAFRDCGLGDDPKVAKAIKWLKGKQLRNGSFGDYNSSLMAMIALQAVHGQAFATRMPLPLFHRIQLSISDISYQKCHVDTGA